MKKKIFLYGYTKYNTSTGAMDFDEVIVTGPSITGGNNDIGTGPDRYQEIYPAGGSGYAFVTPVTITAGSLTGIYGDNKSNFAYGYSFDVEVGEKREYRIGYFCMTDCDINARSGYCFQDDIKNAFGDGEANTKIVLTNHITNMLNEDIGWIYGHTASYSIWKYLDSICTGSHRQLCKIS